MSQEKKGLAEHEDSQDAGFVSRWSRLKHQAAKGSGTEADGNAAGHHPAAENEDQKVEQASSAKVLTDEDMPDIDSLTPDSVYADFLSPGVSDELRKLALRKLFQGEAFNIRDGLDDYDGDYTLFDKLGDIVTSDMQHQIELQAQRRAEQLLQDEQQSVDAAGIQNVKSSSDDAESADDDINRTDRNSRQPGDVHKAADGEDDHQVVSCVQDGDKPQQSMGES